LLSAGSKLLCYTLECAECDPQIKEAVVHMHSANEDARRFYERHGFKVGIR
jgi:ribosomal protein S18 acetylase RimI-like enzyme